ncbi:15759_t:CDS:2 [Cetraspora pellucida]|uniref:15759_t:CDS:1 n=1 Tax=Cetraspora pellucida TaxID=1433469 RepID=A0A9N9NA13_9GLOM|nr:15759_t:CDS:2 [Cetraspora pellucida]
MVLLIKAHHKFYLQVLLLSWFYGSEPCKHFFGIAHQINADFDFAELMQIIPKICHYNKALQNQKLNFDKEKSVRQGYLFDYNKEQLDKLILEKLKLWPTDKQIIQTIHYLYYLACKLSKSLDMIQFVNLFINRNNLLTVSLHENEVSTSYIYNDTNLADIQEIDDISSAISSPLKEVDQFSNNLYNDDFSSNNIFQNSQRQLKIIN